MENDVLLKRVVEVMAERGTTQSGLASSCGLSQPHISKVLSGKVKMASKTMLKLTWWLQSSNSDVVPTEDSLGAAANRLEGRHPKKRMQIMQLLRLVEQLLTA